MSWFTKARDAVENVVAAPAALTGIPGSASLTSKSAQASTLGQISNVANKAAFGVGTGVALGVGAGALGAFQKRVPLDASAPEQLSGPGVDDSGFIDTSPNVSTVASTGESGEKSNATSVASLLQGLQKSVSGLAAANAGARRNVSPAPVAGSNIVPGPYAAGPVIQGDSGGLPGGMLLPIAALAILALKIL